MPRRGRARLPPSFLPVLGLAAAIALARAAWDVPTSYDPTWLVLLGNGVFVGGVGVAVAWIAARNYRATGRVQVLLLGCGVVALGAGAIAAAAVRGQPGGANLNVTVYDAGALVAGALHLAAAFLLLAGASSEPRARRRLGGIVAGYGLTLVVVVAVTGLALLGAFPPFFSQELGPTPLRQATLGGATALFVAALLVFLGTYLRTRERFLYWYASALALTATSLVAFLVERAVGSPVGWLGRVAAYAGGVYFLVGLAGAARSAQSRGTSLDAVLTASLSGAEEKFRALAENAPDVIRWFDHDLRHLYVNAAGLQLYGRAAGAVVGRRMEEAGVPADQARRWDERIARVLRTGERLVVEEWLAVGNEARFWESRCVPERGPDGTVANVLVVTRDLTDRKRTEEALARATVAAEEANRQKDHFLAVLSHELRNPLAPIRNAVHVLERAAPGSDPARRALAVVDRQVTHLARLVDDLLDVTRITRDKIRLHARRIDLGEVVRRTVDDQRSIFEAAGVALDLEAPEAPVPVHGDADRLAQVLGNLLRNAAKFTPRGGAASVVVSADAAARRAVVRVRDTGVGMTAEMLARLFQPFTQADSSLDRSEGGLGLGLALVKGLVELHGGDVTAASAGLGRGAELVVRLPLAEDAPAPAPSAPRAAARRRRVLVVEDNADAAETLRDLLALLGHDVAVARSGPEGLALARALGPDVALCDIGLPGMDGYEVARAFRADAALARTFLVAVSGYATEADLERAARAGFDRHVSKPPRLAELEALLSAPAPAGEPAR